MSIPMVSTSQSLERLTGVVERVTFHNEQNGWSVLKVSSLENPNRLTTVITNQAKVFAGATLEFLGEWINHPKHGPQFKAIRVVEKKPASVAAMEKYLGSGLIRGVGPATAKRIVGNFKDKTLEIFENKIDELLKVPGIAFKKLEQIKLSWEEHKSIRDVMIFLQGFGISTLFATKIYKNYGDKAIAVVSDNPYRLAQDIFGIGFFSADKIALSMGFDVSGIPRLEAGIRHILASSRDEGHCYLLEDQIITKTLSLLDGHIPQEKIRQVLRDLLKNDHIKHRALSKKGIEVQCFYSKSLFYDEITVAKKVRAFLEHKKENDEQRVRSWLKKHCEKNKLSLSDEQLNAICEISGLSFSILTGGPGCGKTTCTKTLVQLLKAKGINITLAAPTGRAAQRMSEVIGVNAKTIHRLLEWLPEKGRFKRDENDPLITDFLIVDETSMLDITLAANILKAVKPEAQVLFIGDPDQLPSVGAGNVLSDLLKTELVPRFKLSKVFRQAKESSIIRFAHEINMGEVPRIISPIAQVDAFSLGHDCLFVDADEATKDQVNFIRKAKTAIEYTMRENRDHFIVSDEKIQGRLHKINESVEVDKLFQPTELLPHNSILRIPDKFKHVDLSQLAKSKSDFQDLQNVLKSVHPWSSLHFGLTALDTVVRLYTKTINEWLGREAEIQILSPQVRGTLGTINLNSELQKISNPKTALKKEVQLGNRLFRMGDRVIQTRNNYDLGVFNGDIGFIRNIDLEQIACEVQFSGGEERIIKYEKEDISDLSLAYAITIHKSQGSEFQAVIIPVLGQHFNMLFRNLIYTGLTRARKLAILVGTRQALAISVAKIDNRKRQTALAELINSFSPFKY